MLHRLDGPPTAHGLAAALRTFVVDQVELLVDEHVPEWRLPGTFGGHRVEPDVAADLIYTLGHLHAGGIGSVAGTPLTTAVQRVLSRIDGNRTHTFFSYRVAETLLRWGPAVAGNPLLDGFDDEQVRQVAVACDSSDWLSLLDEAILPLNYAGVLARCESARLRLGLLDDTGPSLVDGLVERARTVLSSNPWYALDDSNHHVGRYDIYTADVWLFTEPFAPRLGPLWNHGMSAAITMVEQVMSDDGSAVSWGRSTGPLAGALTVELGALVTASRAGAGANGDSAPGDSALGDSAERWVARAALAADAMDGWFDGGVVNAHQHREADGYRGPFRRLQLTLDLLGKLAWAANRLEEATVDVVAAPDADVLAPIDELVGFDPERPAAAAWTHRGDGGGVVVPFVGATRSDYLAAPRAPGRFEVPSDSELACWVPTLFHADRRAVPSGVPATLEHRPDGVTASWDTFTFGAELEPPAEPLTTPGSAVVDYDICGRTVSARWRIAAEQPPDTIAVLVPERADRPLRVTAHGGSGTSVHLDRADVSGVAEWRSHWSALATVHEVEVVPIAGTSPVNADLTITVTPQLRVASTAYGHHYDRSLYGPLTGLVWEQASPWGPLGDATVDPASIDLLHVHWPEWVAFDDEASHRSIVEDVRRRRVPVVWTAHNLTPHEKRPEAYDPIYELWAANVDAVIHHSHVGMERFRERYTTSERTRHVVIPHGHFGELWADHPATDRAEAEAALGLEPCGLRIGIVGAPRAEKLVAEFLRGVSASSRTDVQVACWSLAPEDVVPDDPRIVVAEQYAMADSATYAQRLAACDVLAMPFDPDGDMLATGTVFDAVGLGMPVLRSDWGFLVEVLGDAGILVGHTADSVAAALDALGPEAVRAAAHAAVVRRDELAWDLISARTLALFEDVVTDR